MQTRINASCGFTLIEISVVLVIIGLLVGGILTGRSLIRQSEINTINKDVVMFATATNAFIGKYGYPPGDLPNAQDFWGAQASSCPSNGSTNVSGYYTGTCNGNGNYKVETSNHEVERFWQHLAFARMIPGDGRYQGQLNNSTDAWYNRNLPSASLGKGWWWSESAPSVTSNGDDTTNFSGLVGGYFLLGYAGDRVSKQRVLSPSEMADFDRKYDDGYPAMGKIWVYVPFAAGGLSQCTTATVSSDTTATYLSSKSVLCGLYFTNQY